MITTVLTDLDGTLLPFEQEDFVKLYFGGLCKKLAPLGYQPDHTVKSVWAGTKAMITNDGGRLNSEAFWDTFNAMNPGLPDARPVCDDFYRSEFDGVKQCLKYIPDRKPLIDGLKAAGLRAVLATNPIFPLVGVSTRLGWIGLSPEDFELVTNYDNSTFCKPNPRYYEGILAKLGVKPEECVMLGNSIPEDMTAEKLGMKVFLVNEFIEDPDGAGGSGYAQGNMEQAIDYVKGLI